VVSTCSLIQNFITREWFPYYYHQNGTYKLFEQYVTKKASWKWLIGKLIFNGCLRLNSCLPSGSCGFWTPRVLGMKHWNIVPRDAALLTQPGNLASLPNKCLMNRSEKWLQFLNAKSINNCL
jgi:hypothetical protein